MNVADFIVKFLADKGVRTIFMITGGQVMFLNDAIYRNKKIRPVFTHHEQAAGMATEAYGRIAGKPAVAMVTAGPGVINVLSGVIGAWVDSSPMIVISGQSALPNVQYMGKTAIRQYGLQGIKTEALAAPFTKYFVTVDNPAKVLYYLARAYYLATHERTGPVWLEVPLDIQRTLVPEKLLDRFEEPAEVSTNHHWQEKVAQVLSHLYQSQRPLLLIGQGVRLAGAEDEFRQFLAKTRIPVVTTRLGIDLVESDHPLFIGRPGLYGDRAANLAIQNADLIIVVGARLDMGLIGYDAADWGRWAKKIVVDIDEEELTKPGVEISLQVKGDAKQFFEKLLNLIEVKKVPAFTKWMEIYHSWQKRYPMVLPQYKKEKLVNSYYFTQRLSGYAKSNDTIVVDTSSPFHVVCQTWEIKAGQRFLTTGGISTMGYWPASIGACLGTKGGRTLVVTGDGSLQMNIQELATIKQNKLPIKIFVINNNGYLLIRHTQKTHMEGRLMGESPKTGLWYPDFSKVAKAYDLHFVSINNSSEVDKKIKQVLSSPGPVLCDVKSPQWQLIIPRISSTRQPDGSMVSRPYEDLFPFLSPEELKSNMIAELKT